MDDQVRYVMQPLVSWIIARPYMRETFKELEKRLREVLGSLKQPQEEKR